MAASASAAPESLATDFMTSYPKTPLKTRPAMHAGDTRSRLAELTAGCTVNRPRALLVETVYPTAMPATFEAGRGGDKPLEGFFMSIRALVLSATVIGGAAGLLPASAADLSCDGLVVPGQKLFCSSFEPNWSLE